jgi:hypothetical protein
MEAINGTSNAVDFLGCGSQGPDVCPSTGHENIYDAGAILIENTGPGAMTVDHVSVAIGPCYYEPWLGLTKATPMVLGEGGGLLLTETGGPSPCVGDGVEQAFNFDTSEVNHGSTPCTDDGLIPKITLTTASGTELFEDKSQILNTGGTDPGSPACGAQNKTHLAWTPITPVP